MLTPDDARSIAAREVIAVAALAVALSVVMHWPLPLHLTTAFPKDLGDPLAQAWQLAWGGHRLGNGLDGFFQSNQFWPLRDTLAFSDALIGYAPTGLIGTGPGAAIARYNVVFLFSYALCFVGAYLLCRELGLTRTASLIGATAFAYAPWRLEQDGHLHIVASGTVPLTGFLLLRGWRMRRPGMIFATFAVVAWRVTVGVSVGLLLVYAVGVVGIILLVLWDRSGRPPIGRRVITAAGLGAAVVAGTAFVMSRPYLRVVAALPEAKRSFEAVAEFGGGPQMFLAGPVESTLWGPLTAPVRDNLIGFVPEQTLFPGLAIGALALLGARAGSPLSYPLRRGLVVATAVLAVLALGFLPNGIGQWMPYRFVYEFVPGFSAIRVPERLMLLITLLLAVLAAAGAQRVLTRGRPRRYLPALLLGAVLLDGAGFGASGYAHPTAPARPPALTGIPAPQLHLPADDQDNREYLLWSTAGFPKMMNGKSSVTPKLFTDTLVIAESFPDTASVAHLRALGLRTVILHTDRLRGTPWQDWRQRPVDGLGVTREVLAGLVVYFLD